MVELDRLVCANGENGRDGASERTFIVIEIEPWGKAVDLAAVLDEIAGTFERYLVLPKNVGKVIALWCAHAHCFRAFEHSPRLNFRSPQKQCGKTLLLDVVFLFVPRPVRTENLSTAVFFRVVDKHAPTLLIDEYDAFLHDKEDLRGAINAGHKRGGEFHRCEGDNLEPRGYRVFAPVALAGIKALPGTITDRSLVIEMTRATREEIKGKARFDSRRMSPHNDLNCQLARWAVDHFHELEAFDPELPEDAYNRVADNWRPLFAIAQLAGGEWPRLVREAFNIMKGNDLETENAGVKLLSDIQQYFKSKKADVVASKDLVEYLHTVEESAWNEYGRLQKPITTNQAARLLRPFGIRPGTKREANETFKGYYLDQFTDAFERYIPQAHPNQNVTPSQSKQGAASGDFQTVTHKTNVTDRHPLKPAPYNDCDGVTDRKGGPKRKGDVGHLRQDHDGAPVEVF